MGVTSSERERSVELRIEFETIGHKIRLETSVELIAKMMWHQGHQITARDIFGFAVVAELELQVLMPAVQFKIRHKQALSQQLDKRYVQLKQIDAIDVINFYRTVDDACHIIKGNLVALQEAPGALREDGLVAGYRSADESAGRSA